jgi:hypothetical protein
MSITFYIDIFGFRQAEKKKVIFVYSFLYMGTFCKFTVYI